jgi:hypothetical protein
MKIYYLILPVLGIYFFFASYKGYPSLIGHYFRFKSDKTNKGIDKFHNAFLGIAFFFIFIVFLG